MRITVLTTDSVPLLGGIADYPNGLMSASIENVDWILRTSAPGSNEDDQALSYPVNRFKITPRLLGERFGDGFVPVRKLNTLRWHRAKKRTGKLLVKRRFLRIVRISSLSVVGVKMRTGGALHAGISICHTLS